MPPADGRDTGGVPDGGAPDHGGPGSVGPGPAGGDTPAYLTVRELAGLLRIRERKVYDLAAAGQVPCVRATGKLLFPADEVRAWIDGSRTGAPAPGPRPAPPAIFLGSHDPLLDWALRQSRCGLATFFDGSLDGLARFRAAEGVAAGLHLRDAATGDWNRAAVARECTGMDAVLVSFARRWRGLVFDRAAGPAPEGLADLPGRRLAARQPESGTATLLAQLLAEEGIDLPDATGAETARSEDDAVMAVSRGEADVAFGLQSLAETHDLGFVPLVEERFDLLVDRRAWFEPPMQMLLDFLRRPAFADRAAALGGYTVDAPGQVIWNG